MIIYSYFSHPNNVCMSYLKHWTLSMYYAQRMFFGSIKALIHAFIPFLYKTSTTNIAKDITTTIQTNGCQEIPNSTTEIPTAKTSLPIIIHSDDVESAFPLLTSKDINEIIH